MFIRYSKFIKSDKDEILSILHKLGFDHPMSFAINDDLSVDGFIDIALTNYDIIKDNGRLPLTFNIIHGNFFCGQNNLTTLKGFPKKVEGDFYLQFNRLTSLEFCTKEVDGDFLCNDNLLTSLKGCPEKINGNFDCHDNKLLSLNYCPKFIKGDFNIDGNYAIQNIEDYPLCIINGNIRRDTTYNYYNGIKENLSLIYEDICDIIKQNKELFIPLLDNKIKFHQMIMRIDPGLEKFYTEIQPSKKASRLLL